MHSLLNETMETVSNTKSTLYQFKTLYSDYQRFTVAKTKLLLNYALHGTARFADKR